ncbi:MAG: phospholipid carrier-dependent glycosyltransferase, partial [Christensenellales bacterium]|jgi:dolichyl-phosphate-mannose-protein mannosyltransferase
VGGYGALNTGTAWFDDFYMRKIDEIPAGAASHDFTILSASSGEEQAQASDMPERHTQAWLLAGFGIALLSVALIRKAGRAPIGGERRYRYGFAVALCAAIAARLVIGYMVRGYNTDINCFMLWSERMHAVGFTNFYAADYFCDYPPLYMAMLWLNAGIRELFGIAYNSAAHVLLVKALPILADALLAVFVYRFAKKRVDARAAMLLGAVCALNPAAIVDSAAWGQIDSVFTLFLMLGAVQLSQGAYRSAIPMFTISMLIKPQALLLAPLGLFAIAVDLLRARDGRKALRAAAGLGISLALIAVTALIFREDGANPLSWLFGLLLGTMGSYPRLTVNALNLYTLIGMNWRPLYESMGLAGLSWAMFALSYVYAFWLYWRAKKPTVLFLAGAVLMMLICAFGPMIHERYAYPALILLLLAYACDRDRRILLSLVVLTVTLFLNQVLVLQGGMTEANYGHLQSSEDWLNMPLSLIVVANALYAAYVAFSMIARGKHLPPEGACEGESARATKTLFEAREHRLLLKRADYWIMIGVTAVYAVVAFTNLGTRVAPQTSWTSTQAGEAVEFDLGDEREFHMLYYGGISNTTFTVELSNDGADWTEPQFAAYNQGEIFRWKIYVPSNEDKSTIYAETVPSEDGRAYITYATGGEHYPFQTACYVRIHAVQPGLVLSEIGFVSPDGETLPVSLRAGAGEALLDEQASVPVQPSYYNSTYFDEIYHARTAYEHIHGMNTYEWTHPPLGKVLMMLGIELFGMTAFGWRFMGALMGVAMLPVIYLMVKQLGGKTALAAIAIALLALDSMHFTQTRIATIDSYAVFFIMLMYLFMFRYIRMSFHRQPLYKILIPLALCGITMGCAWATKWIGIYGSSGLAILFFWSLIARYREHRYAKQHEPDAFETDEERAVLARARDAFWRNAGITLGCCLVFFIGIPLVIYYFSYYWQLQWEGGLTIRRVIELQQQMYGYHAGLGGDSHFFRSPWYEWPVIAKPMWYYDGKHFVPEGMISSISCMGNPAVWWTGLIAMCGVIASAAWRRRACTVACVIIVCFLSQYLPWVLVPRSTFIYHYFASVPFIILATVYLLGELRDLHKRAFMIASISLVAAAAALFAAFYPLESGMPVALSYAKYLRWFNWYNY